jgi:hypothetical protein
MSLVFVSSLGAFACGETSRVAESDAGRSESDAGPGSATDTMDATGPTDAAASGPDLFGLRGVWGSAKDDVWFVGQDGKIMHYDGESWALMPAVTGQSLRMVYGNSAEDVWAVGDDVVLHYDGTEWKVALGGRAGDLAEQFLSVWASGPTDVWVSGVATDVGQGILRRWNGTAWDVVVVHDASSLWAVWGSGATDVWTGGQAYLGGGATPTGTDGYLRRGDGTTFDLADYPGGSVRAIWGSSSSDVWVAPYDGPLHHWDGQAWSPVDRPSPALLLGGAGLGPDESWAVGNQGTVFHFDGTDWKSIEMNTTANFISVWPAASDDVWLVGSRSTLRHFDGNQWRSVGTPMSAP